MVQFEATFSENTWYRNYIYPLIYEGYPLNGSFKVNWRAPEVLGIVPYKGIYLQQTPKDRRLTESDLSSGSSAGIASSAVLKYNLPHYIEQDLINLQNQAANTYVNGSTPPERIKMLLLGDFPKIQTGTYGIDIKYILPGASQTTTIHGITIRNFPAVIR